jgi:hypothetical protein
MDARWRQLPELLYPDHGQVWDLIFKKGEWKKAWFVYDEDDDCNRWERVELYQPLDPFKIGTGKGGIDQNAQADPAGDRGEWDEDFSGKGQLYVSRFDGRIHLYGAEWGVWRIDQNSRYYQGMGNLYDGYGPKRMENEPVAFPTVKYTDTDQNGFFDLIEYDLDGDSIFESKLSLRALGLDDRADIIPTESLKYADFTALMNRTAEALWANAQQALSLARKNHINTSWYALMMHPKSIREKYHYGYWLQFYLYKDMEDLYLKRNDKQSLEKLAKAYLSGNWNIN